MHWSIQKTNTATEFNGLGQLKNITLPHQTDVLIDKTTSEILAVPGVSGSLKSKTETDTRKLFVEVANFKPEKVAQNSFNLNYRSDASKFFASQVNPSLQFVWLTKLIQILDLEKNQYQLNSIFSFDEELGNVTLLELAKSHLQKTTKLRLDFEYLANRLDARGSSYWQPIILQKLSLIGNINQENQDYYFSPYTFYGQIQSLEDVLDRAIKLIGFENLQPQNLTFESKNLNNDTYKAYNQLKNFVASFGFNEVITRPFVKKTTVLPSSSLELLNPYSSQEPFLRGNILASLLPVVSSNLNKGQKAIQIFELTEITTKIPESNQVVTKSKLEAVAVTEQIYTLTTLIHRLSQKLKLGSLQSVQTLETELGKEYNYIFEKQDFDIRLIEIKNSIKKEFDINLNKKIWYLDLDLTNWDLSFYPYKKYQDQSSFPSINRSFSLSVSPKTTWQQIFNTLTNITIKDCLISINPTERLVLTDTEVVNFEVNFVSYTRVLNNEEIVAWTQQLLENLQKIDISVKLR